MRKFLFVIFTVLFVCLGYPLTAFSADMLFTPDADAYVADTIPDTNRGTAATMWVKKGEIGFFRFKVVGTKGEIKSAKISLFCSNAPLANNTPVAPINVHVADKDWDEKLITFENMPKYEATPFYSFTMDTSRLGQTITIDVTDYIKGDGEYCFALVGTVAPRYQFATKEYNNRNVAPQLTLTGDELVSNVVAPTLYARITEDGYLTRYPADAHVIDGVPMVPLRSMFEKFGASVRWDEDTQNITVNGDSFSLNLTVGDKIASLNGNVIILDASPRIIDDAALLQADVVIDALGLKMKYFPTNRVVAIDTGAQPERIPYNPDNWPYNLEIFDDNFPKTFIFRNSEQTIHRWLTYEDWEKIHLPFNGIMGKVLEEEVPERSLSLTYFSEFKKRYPEKLVMLHYNGRSIDPVDSVAENFFPGHFIYYQGCKIASDVPATKKDTTIKVDDATLFRINIGLLANKNDDILMCGLKADGTLDWYNSEELKLISVDRTNNTIVVRRAMYGTEPKAFKSGKAYLAPHMVEGPWGNFSNLIWGINYSSDCPRDREGKRALDVRAETVSALFAEDGPLYNFDGLEFDVLYEVPFTANDYIRGVDLNGDTVTDYGLLDPTKGNTIENRKKPEYEYYKEGMHEFGLLLRKLMGDKKFIQGDGMDEINMRNFDSFNGMESEGFQDLQLRFTTWSSRINAHSFWNANGTEPIFHYVNHKYTVERPKTGSPMHYDRISLAGACLTDAFITYATLPPNVTSLNDYPQKGFPIYDELICGTENKDKWLGRAVGDTMHTASDTPRVDFAEIIVKDDVSVTVGENNLVVANPNKKHSDPMVFTIKDVPATGGNVTLMSDVSVVLPEGYRKNQAICITVQAVMDGKDFGSYFGLANEKPFPLSFAFSGITTDTVDLLVTIEESEYANFDNFGIYNAPDVCYREFENGLVIANPSDDEIEFNIGEYLPHAYRHIQGTPEQDPVVNNGQDVDGSVKIGPYDGLFLVKK